MLYQVLVVGYGIVGKILGEELAPLCPDIYDKYIPENHRRCDNQYDLVFICANTPFVDENNPCDTTEVFRAVMENDTKLFVVKSTVLPRTCEKLADQAGKRIVFSPESAGHAQFSRNYWYGSDLVRKNNFFYDAHMRYAQEMYLFLQNTYPHRRKPILHSDGKGICRTFSLVSL